MSPTCTTQSIQRRFHKAASLCRFETGINPNRFEIGSGFQVLNFQAKVIPVDVSTFLPQNHLKCPR